ncbi:unnamed protein product [Vitrella brassicaformis CCMP3155]|uniref:Uncharacterized protein n=1 Tax=Vitrella brassicaformis (strain CCMP3155) TaxID=1169540 RepID=A0A0G4FFL8_VITBC|nr:unnamed protein product [Vitrella brassicaformis CCMP3155]|eukprot:CEM11832.1 unnamed protein product [Vitrella brassicaformis CCMP3155]
MAGSGQAAGASMAPASISELRAEGDVLLEKIRQLHNKIKLSCDVRLRQGGASGDTMAALLSLGAASGQFRVAESAVSAGLEAITTVAALDPTEQASGTAAAALDGPQHTNDSGSPAAAIVGGGSGSGGEMDVVDASPDGPAAEVAAADSDLSVAAPQQPSYRQVHVSGRQPPNQPPGRLRLSRDELANVFGSFHPWELTHRRRVLGQALFDAAAANYTHLTIDGSAKGGVRQLWGRMPHKTAYKWGQRASHLTHLHTILPFESISRWCRGTWVALIEGNAAARKAINDEEKKVQQEGGEEGTARPAHHVPQPASSIKVISFDDDHDSSFRCDTSAEPLPPSPVDLSNLEEVHNMPCQYAAVRAGRRVWRAPRLRVLTFGREQGYGVEDIKSNHSCWMEACEHLEKFDVDTILLSVKQGLLSFS